MNRRTAREGGFTLPELLIVLVVLGVVSAITTTTTISGMQATRRTQERVFALSDLTKGLERIGRELRAADPLDLSTVASVAEASYVIGATVERGGVTTTYRYFLEEQADGTPALVEQAVPESSGPVPTSLFIVNTVNEKLGIPLITYLDVSGQALECDASLAIAECRAYLATARQIRLTLVRDLPEQDPIIVETYINVRRARIS